MTDGAAVLDSSASRARFAVQLTPLRLVVGLSLLALAVRLIGLGVRPFWLDEAYSAWFSAQTWHALWTQVPTYEPHPPFYYSLLKIWREIFGGSAFALRSSSLLFVALTVPLVAAAAAELERQQPTGRPLLRVGIAAFLFAYSPMLIVMGTEARPYPLLIFSYALALVGALKLMREFASGSAGSWASWLLLVAGAELGLWAHGLGVLYALCLALAIAPAWLKHPFTAARLSRGIAAALLVVLLYTPCLSMMMNRAADWGTGWLSWNPIMILQLLSLYSVPVEVLTVGSAVAALVMILLAKRAVQFGFEGADWNGERAMLILWWGPPLLAILISQLAIPIFLPRALTPTLVPAYVALGGALARAGSARERLILIAALAITLTPAAVQTAVRPATEPWDEVATYITHHAGPRDQLWIYPNDSALPLREAGLNARMRGIPGDYPAVGFKGPIRAGSPAVVSVTSEQAAKFAGDSSVKEVPVIWLVTRQSGVFDPAGDMPAALAHVRRPGQKQEWGYISVTPYYRR